MCDLRGPPRKIKNNDTGQVFEVPYIGSMFNWEEKLILGVYHQCGSGCGYTYFDGKEWFSGYSGKPYEFMDFAPNLNVLNLWEASPQGDMVLKEDFSFNKKFTEWWRDRNGFK